MPRPEMNNATHRVNRTALRVPANLILRAILLVLESSPTFLCSLVLRFSPPFPLLSSSSRHFRSTPLPHFLPASLISLLVLSSSSSTLPFFDPAVRATPIVTFLVGSFFPRCPSPLSLQLHPDSAPTDTTPVNCFTIGRLLMGCSLRVRLSDRAGAQPWVGSSSEGRRACDMAYRLVETPITVSNRDE